MVLARANIRHGLLVLLGIEVGDTDEDLEWLCGKIAPHAALPEHRWRDGPTSNEAMGEILLVSQFTLPGQHEEGQSPQLHPRRAADEAVAAVPARKQLLCELDGHRVKTGEFGADMQVALVNDGPVTMRDRQQAARVIAAA